MLVETAASDVVTVLMVMGSEAELNAGAIGVDSVDVDVVVSGVGSGCGGAGGRWGAGGGWGAIGGNEGACTKIIIIMEL